MAGLLIIGELFLLSLLSNRLIQSIYAVFLLIFRSRTLSVTFVTLILFPGTVIHELAHLFTAEVLGVRTGKLTLTPESIRGEDIQSGSVAVAQTDSIRRAVIGLAPTLFGLVGLLSLSYVIPTQWAAVTTFQGNVFQNPACYILALCLYLIFAISMTMFPSAIDIQGTPAVFITLFLFIFAAYIVGVRVALTGKLLVIATSILSSLHQSLVLVLALNIVLLLTNYVLVDMIGKITHRKIVRT